MKIGIVGGTFNPVHIAHLYLVTECRTILNLDRMLIIPNGDPPHKDYSVTDKVHRYNMVKLASRDYKDVTVSDMEVKSSDPSYTFKTLEILKNKHKEDQLYFIIGADSLINFKTWKKPERILELSTLVCFDRPGYKSSEVESAANWIREKGGDLIIIDSLELEISSTDIRNRIKENKPVQAFLHPEVYKYMLNNGLYKGE